MRNIRAYILWGILTLCSTGELGAIVRQPIPQRDTPTDGWTAGTSLLLPAREEMSVAASSGDSTAGRMLAVMTDATTHATETSANVQEASVNVTKDEAVDSTERAMEAVTVDEMGNVRKDSTRRTHRLSSTSRHIPLDEPLSSRVSTPQPLPERDSLNAQSGPADSLSVDSLSMSAHDLEGMSLPDSLSMADSGAMVVRDSSGMALRDSSDKATVQRARFLPTRRRMDREIDRNRFIFKREVAVGLTVSYGVISSDDTDFMLLLDNLNFSGSVFTINPSVGYFIRDNLSVGVRFGYSKTKGDINSLALNLGSSNDLDISLTDLHLTNNAASAGIFMRSYAGIDAKGHFGLFAELELSYKNGETVFSYKSNEEVKYTRSNSQQYKFSFNPGCAVFIFPNVCSTLSFGLGGLQYTKIKQTDHEGNVIGQRDAAKMRFRLNLLNIRIGLNILL